MPFTSTLIDGETVIPTALCEQLGIKDGDQLIWEVRDDGLLVTTRLAQLRRAQALVQKYAPSNGVSMVDELIAERRAETASE
ncbi:MAG: AbrB/MazE/SpoVT family DNA-binding domain-containing protein [Betaproteobacteria bacterium]|nr:AbrB/MazE/SpoVT family DNA-binding domain-containing protein [Betaproteobacteria bacterium]